MQTQLLTAEVGCPKSQFQREAIRELAQKKAYSSDVRNLAALIDKAAQLCNAYGGIRALDSSLGKVKNMCKELKELLSEQAPGE